jgi:hypothetical protein
MKSQNPNLKISFKQAILSELEEIMNLGEHSFAFKNVPHFKSKSHLMLSFDLLRVL